MGENKLTRFMRLGRGVVDFFVPRNKVETRFIVKSSDHQLFIVKAHNLVLIENQFFRRIIYRPPLTM
jgi:hypothetical protein